MKKIYLKKCPVGQQKSIKGFIVRKIRDFFCYHPSELSPRVRQRQYAKFHHDCMLGFGDIEGEKIVP